MPNLLLWQEFLIMYKKCTYRKFFILFLFLSVATACTTTEHKQYYPHNRLGEYQQGTSLPELKMPPGMQVIQPDPYYQIPPVNASLTSVSILPPGSSLMKQVQEKQQQKEKS